MWHRFTSDLRRVVIAAEREMYREGARDIATRHLLIALLDPNAGLGGRILRRLCVSDLEASETLTEAGASAAKAALTPAARAAAERGYAEAVAWNEGHIGTEHLLFGLLRTPGGAAAGWLDQQGVTVQTATEALFSLETERHVLPPGAKLPNRTALQVNGFLSDVRHKTALAKRAVGAIPLLPKEPLLLTFLARPVRIRYPHWFFRNLRNRGFYRSEVAGGWMLTDYDSVVRVLKEPALSAARYDWEMVTGSGLPPLVNREFNRLCGALARQMLFLDAPEQTRLRSLVSRQFTPRVLEGMRTTIQSVADELLDRVMEQGQMDVIADFAFPLPATVIARLLGVDERDLQDFKQWSDEFVRFITNHSDLASELRSYHSLNRLAEYFGRVIAEKRGSPKDDTLISLFVHAEDADGARLTDDEVIVNSMLILAAGHETTTHLVGNGLVLLLRNPAARRALVEDPSLWASAIEEILRFEPPVQWTSRVARADFELNGVTVRKGEWVNISLAAANRDPNRFPDADRFDVHREDNRHLSFGSGPHFCLGAALARMEGAIALSTILRRFPDLRLAHREAHWRDDFTFRAQTSLPVKWGG